MNLDQLEIGEELNPLAYDPQDYPTIDEVVGGILSNDRPKEIDLKKLSKRGTVVRDTMTRYLSKHDHINSSALKEVLRNPASFYFYINDKSNFEETKKDHFELGTFAHMAFLEPQLFDNTIEEPVFDLRTLQGANNLVDFWEKEIQKKYLYEGVQDRYLNTALEMTQNAGLDVKKLDGMKFYANALRELSGYTVIKSSHKLIIDIIKKHYYTYGGGIIPRLLHGASFETSFYGKDPDTGLKVRVRPDAFQVKENIGVDAVISFKTTHAEDLSKFIYDSAKYKYEVSEGFYQNTMSHITGRNFNTTIMIVLQTVAPYLPAVLMWSPDDLANGKYKARHALDTIKECHETGRYPGFESLAETDHYGIIQMQQPEWAQKMLHPVDLED